MVKAYQLLDLRHVYFCELSHRSYAGHSFSNTRFDPIFLGGCVKRKVNVYNSDNSITTGGSFSDTHFYLR